MEADTISPLTLNEARSIARKRGWVYWPNSGIYEQLSIGDYGRILAEGFRPGKRGPIRIRPHRIDSFYCLPIGKDPLIKVGDLFIALSTVRRMIIKYVSVAVHVEA